MSIFILEYKQGRGTQESRRRVAVGTRGRETRWGEELGQMGGCRHRGWRGTAGCPLSTRGSWDTHLPTRKTQGWRPPWVLEAGRGHLDLSWRISSFGNTEHCLPTPAATSLCVYAHALPPFVLGELGCNCEPAPGVRDEEVPPGVGGVCCGV